MKTDYEQAIDCLNQKLWKLFHDPRRHRGSYVPRFSDSRQPVCDSLVVLSLNPSLPQRLPLRAMERYRQLGVTFLEGRDYREQFEWANSTLRQHYDNEEVARLAQIHSVARHCYPRFFSRINNLAEHLGVSIDDYAHLDIWKQLDPNAQNIPPICTQPGPLRDFQEGQFKLCLDELLLLSPRIILFPYLRAATEFCRALSNFHQLKDCMPNNVFLEGLVREGTIMLPGLKNPTRIIACSDLPRSRSPRFTDDAVEQLFALIQELMVANHGWNREP